MKKPNYLKGLRVLLAVLIFVPILLFFLDFADILPDQVSVLLHLQLMPALLGLVPIFVIMSLLTLVFGRFYCSIICPAGVLQDVINRVFCFKRKKKNGVYRFNYRRPMNALRYGLLGLTAITGFAGFINLCLLLDPYSNFGRIATNLFRPLVMWTNNLTAEALMAMDNYTLYHVTVKTVTTAGFISGTIALLLFIALTVWRGRIFCNTLCPVGAWLSLFSRYSLFRISFDKGECTHCGLCERSCKAEAIDYKNMTVDTSRCVDCFNCVSSCSKGGLQFRFQPAFRKEKVIVAETQQTSQARQSETINSRRTFLATGVTVAATLPVVSTIAQCKKGHKNGKHSGDRLPITPPGSLSVERFKDKCTGCQLCVIQCPSQVLRPAGLQYGFEYMLKPYISYESSYCNYECTVCADVCPTHAIRPITKEEKATTQVGVAIFHINRCIVKTNGTDCGACSEHCPTQAVHMIPYEGTLTIPKVNPDLCIGCGGCESICPVRPMPAIAIHSNAVHKFVEKPKQEEVKHVEVEDFGF